MTEAVATPEVKYAIPPTMEALLKARYGPDKAKAIFEQEAAKAAAGIKPYGPIDVEAPIAKTPAEAAKAAPGMPAAPAKTYTGPPKVILTWKRTNPWVLHYAHSGGLAVLLTKVSGDPNAVVTPEQVQEALSKADPFIILPDTHEYDAAKFFLVNDHPHVLNQIKNGNLVIQTKGALGLKVLPGESAGDLAQTLPSNLDKVDTAKAIELADTCGDSRVLKIWLQNERTGQKRDTVVDILKQKLANVEDIDKRMKPDFEADKTED